jgi:hypothetical protein
MMDACRRREVDDRRSEVLRPQIEVFGLKQIVCATMKKLMTPSELTALLARANDRLRSALTGASSLVLLALLALISSYGVHKIQAGMAKTVAVLAVLGVALLILAYRFFRWQRDELYDDVVLHGFRHVHPQAVARRAAELVSRRQRRQIADTLDRFVEAAVENHPTPVPVHRGALIELRPQVAELSTILRTPDVELEPAGMVLLGRFISDGATSPLFKLNAHPTEMERELARISRVLNREREAA